MNVLITENLTNKRPVARPVRVDALVIWLDFMKTINRICIEDFVLEAKNGDRLELKRGEEYLTSPEDENNEVCVFSRFWARVPIKLFAGAKVFTN